MPEISDVLKNKTTKTPRDRILRRLAWLMPVLVLLFLLVDYYTYSRFAPIGGQSLNCGKNGLWLRYKWYFGEHTDAQTIRLAQNLVKRQIRYAYFHVRSVEGNGSLRYRLPQTGRKLVSRLHQLAPSVKLIAWIYAGNERGKGAVNLENPQVRQKMVKEAAWLVRECGFDGVQWDYEVCPDGDRGFLQLLTETRLALPQDTIIGVCAPIWLPVQVGGLGWSDEYFTQVGWLCDQIAVMCYDTGAVLPRAYVWLIREQARHVPRAVAQGNRNCKVILGLPTYGKGMQSHNPHAENLRLGLKGVREGSSNSSTSCTGVALFAEYTTDEAEWLTYQDLWLENHN